MSTWKDYLTKPTAISKRMGLDRSTIHRWIGKDLVPSEHFIKLVDVLAGLNIKLTIEQMGELNDD